MKSSILSLIVSDGSGDTMGRQLGRHRMIPNRSHSVDEGSADKWHTDSVGSYHERYVNDEESWTGWVTDRYWDPRVGGPPDGKQCIVDEHWALAWYGERIAVVGASGFRLNAPATSLVSCIPLEIRRESGSTASLELVFEFGGPPSAAPPRLTHITVTLLGTSSHFKLFRSFSAEVLDHREQRARGFGRKSRSSRDKKPESRADWHEDPYGRFTQRRREPNGDWSGWVLDRLWDPSFPSPGGDVAVRNQAGAVQWHDAQIAAVGESGVHLICPDSAYRGGDLIQQADPSRQPDLAPMLRLNFGLTTDDRPESDFDVVLRLICTDRAEEDSIRVLERMAELRPRPKPEVRDRVGVSSDDAELSGGVRDKDYRRSEPAGRSSLYPAQSDPSPIAETLSIIAEARLGDHHGRGKYDADSPADRVLVPDKSTGHDHVSLSEPTVSASPSLRQLVFDVVPGGEDWTTFAPLSDAIEIRLVRDSGIIVHGDNVGDV